MIVVTNHPLINFPPFMCDAIRKLFHPVLIMVRTYHKFPLRLHLLFYRYFWKPTGCYHYLILGSGLLSSLSLLGNTTTIQSMLCTSSSGAILVNQSSHRSTLWVWCIAPNDLIPASSQSYYKWTTSTRVFIPMFDKSSSTVTPTVVTTDTNISGS